MSVALATSSSPAAAPAGSAKLTGTVIGTAGSYKSQGNTIANVFDKNVNTFFDSPGTTGWVGLDLGTPETISQIQYVPRSGFNSRMVGGMFQASNTADFSSGVTTLFTVTASPAYQLYTSVPITNTAAYEFVRYVAPANGYGNVSEIEFDGLNLTPTSVPIAPTMPAASVSYTDVHLSWQEDPTSVVSSYTVERQGPTDISYVPIGTTNTGVTSFDDTTALASTQYSYVIVANNILGSSTSAATVINTPAAFVNPWTNIDIGAPAKTGSAIVNPTGLLTVSGGGADIWNNTDAFNYEYQSLVGNGSITVQVASQTNTSSWAKSGIMIRETTSSESRFVDLVLTPGNGVSMQARTATHTTPTMNVIVAGKAGVWLQLQRNGSVFSGYVSTDDVNWTLVGSVNITMVNNVTAGLCVTAHDNTKLNVSTFNSASIVSTDVEGSAWSDGAAAPMTRWESETFSYNNKLYVFGGFIDRGLDATTECDVYDPVANTWSYLTSVPTGALTHASVTMIGDTAYFAGGDIGTFSKGKPLTSTSEVLTYDVTTGAWGSVTSLPAPESCGGLVNINNSLYYYGGLNANDTADLSNTWSLNLNNPAASWVAEAAMPDARNHLGYAAINGIAYAVGGGHLYNEITGNDAEVDAYNPVTNTWTTITPLPMKLSSNETTTMVVNGKIVVVGGQTNGGYDGIYQNTIEEYDPVANLWSSPGNLPEANEGESVAYIDNELVVADGTVDNQGGWSQNQVWIDSEIVL